MANDRESNFAWISNQNLSEYEGKWVVVVNKQVVSFGDDPEVVIKESREKFPEKTPYLLRVPSEMLASS